jgi:hypothetical protein
MRFSTVFQFPLPLPRAAQPGQAARVEVPAIVTAAPAPAAPASASVDPASPSLSPADLPDDLDARVRLVGEWQLGEG